MLRYTFSFLLFLIAVMIFSCSDNPADIDSNPGTEPDTFTLNITLNGEGSFTTTPEGTIFENGEEVTITIEPRVTWNFNEWSGDISGTDNPVTVTMNRDISAMAELSREPEGTPPFWGTIFIDPNIITEDDPSAFTNLTYAGQDNRVMYDRRVHDWTTVYAHLFDAVFDDGLTIEIQVNPEFGGPEDAQVQAEKYAFPIGQLSTRMRRDVETVWIHAGYETFGGGNNNLLIHTEMGEEYIDEGILEEVFIHEAVHTSMDADYANSQGWRDAQYADNHFISLYAQEFPDWEDLAESFLPYIAIRYFSERIPDDLKNTIKETMPNRIAFFDSLEL
jgi:hypothetical protein